MIKYHCCDGDYFCFLSVVRRVGSKMRGLLLILRVRMVATSSSRISDLVLLLTWEISIRQSLQRSLFSEEVRIWWHIWQFILNLYINAY